MATPDIVLYSNMPIAGLSNFATVENVFVTDGKRQGILIGIMDMEPGKNAVKVLADGEIQHWSTEKTSFVRSEPRNWVKI